MKIYVIGMCILMFGHSAYALNNVEIAKAAIVKTLQQKNPAALTEFNDFFIQYDQLVTAFFDNNNNESLKTHIQHMEEKLALLESVCNNPQFSSVRSILMNYKSHLYELIPLLKSYKRGIDILPLAFKVHRFKFLLPKEVQQRNNIALFLALHHRLTCGKKNIIAIKNI